MAGGGDKGASPGIIQIIRGEPALGHPRLLPEIETVKAQQSLLEGFKKRRSLTARISRPRQIRTSGSALQKSLRIHWSWVEAREDVQTLEHSRRASPTERNPSASPDQRLATTDPEDIHPGPKDGSKAGPKAQNRHVRREKAWPSQKVEGPGKKNCWFSSRRFVGAAGFRASLIKQKKGRPFSAIRFLA